MENTRGETSRVLNYGRDFNFITVTVNGYKGEIRVGGGGIGMMEAARNHLSTSGGIGTRMPNPAELREYAEYILALAEVSEERIIFGEVPAPAPNQ